MIAALDFETDRFGPANMAPPPVVLAYSKAGEEHLTRWDEAEGPLEAMLAGDEPVSIVNGPYDMAVTCAHYPRLLPLVFDAYDRGVIKDPLIRQKLIDLALGERSGHPLYSLEVLVERFTGEKLNKEGSPRLDYARLRHVPIEDWPPQYRAYALDDARWHRRLYEIQKEGLIEEGALEVLDDEDRQTRADFALGLMSAWGIRTDKEGVDRLREECQKRQEEIAPALLEAGLLVYNARKGVTAKKVRLAQQRRLDAAGGKYESVKLTKTGKKLRRKGDANWRQVKYVSVDAEACGDSGDPLLDDFSEHSQLGTLLSGHVKALQEGVTLPLHSRFECLLETGRTSSSAPNIQNVRRKPGARECFKPRDGTVYVGCDFDKAELHTLAQTCIDIFGHSALGDALNAGFDPHTGLGAKLAHVPYEHADRLIVAHDEGMLEWRQRAKPGNFGFPGGMGPRGMMAYAKSTYGVILSFEESTALYNGWREQWPVVQEYLEWIRNLCGATGYADLKHFKSNRWRTKVPYCAAANSFFQGRAADGAKEALYEVTKRCYSVPSSDLYGCRPVNFVHDEIIMEAPLEQANAAAWEMQRVMVDAFNSWVPDVPVKATPCLMDRWSKKAQTLTNDAGELQVWHYQEAA